MRKLLRFFLLCFALASVGVLCGSAAYASTITGMVGVGTWNTQADFAAVKVVQGNNTLYQSNFALGMSEWKRLSGAWQTTPDGSLHQSSSVTPALALVGSPAWTNYTITLRARKTGGAEGFLITFGSPGDATQTQWNIGGWGNTQHNIQSPGVWLPPVNGSVQTGVWYDIRVEVQGTDIRCYLNGALIHDTARVLDINDRSRRFQTLMASFGFNLINSGEQQWLRSLAARNVYLGNATLATFAAMPSAHSFNTMTAAQQEAVIRQVNRNRLTWNTGWGFGSDAGRDQTIINSIDSAVMLYNQLGLFDSHIIADNSVGTPTADSNYNGEIRFGNLDSYRVALHESSHFLGTGTYGAWGNFVINRQWAGFYADAQSKQFDGIGAVSGCDSQHYWPYGMNYDNEYSDLNAYRHVFMVHAFRRDMGIATYDVVGSTSFANGAYVLMPRHAQGSALDVQNSVTGNGAQIDIHTYTGSDSQKFLFDLQSDGTYRIRTALAGNRSLDLPAGITDNGNKLQLLDDNGLAEQRWYIIPTGDGWFRIAPKSNVYKGFDVNGGPNATADGSAVQNWDYWDGLSQQWRLLPANDFYTTRVPNGTYVLKPQHAPGSALETPNNNSGNGVQLDISAYTGGDSQKFLLDLQSDGTYRIRTALAGNRSLDLSNGFTFDGNKIQLWDDNGGVTQRWYLIPITPGWYRIAAKMNIDMGLDVTALSPANGSLVQLWDYLGGANQLWSLNTPAAATTTVTGRLALEGVSDLSAVSANAPLGAFHVEFRLPGATTVIKSADVALTPVSGSPYGAFSIPAVVTGIYDIAIKGPKSLRVLLPKTAVNGSSPLPDQTLSGGDANNDNAIDLADFGILIGAYNSDASIDGTGYDIRADFNDDGVVDSTDFGLLIGEYGSVGAP